MLRFGFGAVEKTRTSTGVTPQRPQRCASTNSATTAILASSPINDTLKKMKQESEARSKFVSLKEISLESFFDLPDFLFISCRTGSSSHG